MAKQDTILNRRTRLVAAWRTSGETKTAFARRHGCIRGRPGAGVVRRLVLRLPGACFRTGDGDGHRRRRRT